MLILLNYYFFVFHTALVLFNLLGWTFKKTRRLNLLTLSLTAFSWFVMGIWYGWGYCLCTDWHWQVREKLGYHDESDTYIHLLLLKLTGVNFPTPLVEMGTLVGFLLSFGASLFLNVKDFTEKRRRQRDSSLQSE